jgi:transposase
MDVLAFKRQGMTIAEIAEATDYHPATIAKWLKEERATTEAGGAKQRAGDRRALGRAHPVPTVGRSHSGSTTAESR